MDALQAVEIVLREAGGPLHYREITDRVLKQKLWTTEGKTPENTINAGLSVDIDDGGPDSRFIRVGRGIFALRDTIADAGVADRGPPSQEQPGATAIEEGAVKKPDEPELRGPVNPEWSKLLLRQLEQTAQGRQTPAVLRVNWPNMKDVWFDVRIMNGKALAVVDEHVIALLDRIDPKAIVARLTDPGDKEKWPRWANMVRAAPSGSNVSLSRIGATIGSPLAGNASMGVDVYRQFEVDKESLRPLLPPDVMTKLDAEPRMLTLRRLGEIIGIPIYRPDSGRAAPGKVGKDTSSPRVLESPLSGSQSPEQQEARDHADDIDEAKLDLDISRNVIYFGPPGTGKSHQLDAQISESLGITTDQRKLRVTFHPEYTYFDFIGNYRPAVGWLANGSANFQPEVAGSTPGNAEPRVYYVFDPGPLSLAIKAAVEAKGQSVVLIIEEINRGNCAAIFGDVFQLLDRKADLDHPDAYGLSQYPINPTGAWAAWLETNLKGSPAWQNGQLRLPQNLFIYATMNTSDQSLFPMDTAFRRRWSMVYVGVDSGDPPPTLVPVRHDLYIPWADLMRAVNKEIVSHTGTDDKQMGPWFVRARRADHKVEPAEFASKVLFYLWSDVFRDTPGKLFRDGIRTYDELVRTYLRERKAVFIKEPAASVATAIDEAAGASPVETANAEPAVGVATA